MAAQIALIVTENPRGTVASLYTQGAYIFGDFFSNEAPTVSVTRVTEIQQPTGSRIWQPQSLAGYTVRVALGQVANQPLAGTYTLTFDGDTTTALAFDATAADVEAALNALPSMISAGLCDVVADATGFFVVTFRDTGDQTQITGDTTNLAPLSTVKAGTLIDGDVTLQEVQSLQICTQPAAFTTLTDALPSAAVNITPLTVGGGGFNAKYQIVLSPFPYDGNFTLAIPFGTPAESAFIPFNSSASTLKSAIGAMPNITGGEDSVDVSQQGDGSWIVMFIGDLADTDIGDITGDASALSVMPGVSGPLDLRNSSVDLLLGGKTQIDVDIEVELTPPAGTPFKVVGAVTTKLNRALITPGSASPPLIAIPTSEVSTTITDLQGGTDAYLDNVATVSIPVGFVMQFVRTGVGFVTYQLQSSTAATAAPGVVRPLDYAGTTNEKVWFQES